MIKTGLLLVAVAGCGGGDEPSDTPPPSWGVPISGGTVTITHDGVAVVGDPDRDRVLMVDVAAQSVIAEVALPNDEPGRIIEDAAGRVHVALRRGGAIVTFASGRSGDIIARRPVCGEPRGLAYDAATDLVHVACSGGELVSLPASGGEAVRSLRLDRDLRDVVVSGTGLVVTRFRSAEILTVDSTGAIASRVSPPIVQRFGSNGDFGGGLVNAMPSVAWRSIPLAGGKVLISHQRQINNQLRVETGGYGGGCGGGPVETAFTLLSPGQPATAVSPFAVGALPVDIAVSPNGQFIAAATAGNNAVQVASVGTLNSRDEDQCGRGGGGGTFPGEPNVPGGQGDELGAPTSVAFTPNNELVIFYPEVPALVVRGQGVGAVSTKTIMLPGELGYDSGRGLFHGQTAIGLACASCHPEGRDDGRVWDFAGIGMRRTQSLAGGILERGPYHWVGDMTTLEVLMDDVFANRMSGGTVSRSQKISLGPWLNRIPAPMPVPAVDATAVERGKEVFAAAQCATCHNGALYTNNQLVNVGTGTKFKVPSLLGVAARAPYMHNGCAATLRDRFGACGGGDLHGVTSTLTQPQLDDLLAFLESL